eukprot:g444.t1
MMPGTGRWVGSQYLEPSGPPPPPPALRKVRLGKTNFEVTRVSFGGWGIGGDWSKHALSAERDDEQSRAALRAFLDAGGNMVDTANCYGDNSALDAPGFGRSERLIGQVLRERRAAGDLTRVYVVTKAGRVPGAGVEPEGGHDTGYSYTYDQLLAAANGSRRRLGVPRLDLLQLHCPPTHVLENGEVFAHCERLVTEGVIAHWGCSVETLAEADLCLARPSCASIQVIFNPFRLKPLEGGFLARARAADVGVLARVPLASGLLTGKFDRDSIAEAHFAPDDHRRFNRGGQCFDAGETWSGLGLVLEQAALPAVEELRALVPAGLTMAQFALAWTAAVADAEGVGMVAIPGCRTAAQARANAAAAASAAPRLGPAALAGVRATYDRHVREHVHGKW